MVLVSLSSSTAPSDASGPESEGAEGVLFICVPSCATARMRMTFAASSSLSGGCCCRRPGPLTASMSFCEIGLKRFSSPEANLAICNFLYDLGFNGLIRFYPLKSIEPGFQLARQLSVLVGHFVCRVQLIHGPSLFLALADIGSLRNVGRIATNVWIRSPVKCLLHVGDQLPLDPCASSFNRGEDYSN